VLISSKEPVSKGAELDSVHLLEKCSIACVWHQ
jgi:hypothetical protein